MSEDTNSAELFARCRRGDAAAWRDLVLKTESVVIAIGLRHGLGRETALDVAQETYMTLIARFDGIRNPDRLLPWLKRTAERHCLRRVREARLATQAVSALHISDSETRIARDRLRERERDEEARVFAALETLDPASRDLLLALHGPDAVTYREAARRLGVPIGSIGPSRLRALEKLRDLLQRDSD